MEKRYIEVGIAPSIIGCWYLTGEYHSKSVSWEGALEIMIYFPTFDFFSLLYMCNKPRERENNIRWEVTGNRDRRGHGLRSG